MSIRNGQVTRWKTDTLYTIEWFDVDDRQIHRQDRVAKGKKDVAYLRKLVKRQLTDRQTLVDLTLRGYEARLYAMPQEQYYANAKIIERKSI